MPDAAQNTLGLFDSTALGWTVDTPRAEPEPLAATSGEPDAESVRHGAAPPMRGRNFYLETDRGLARGWSARARDNLAAIRLSKELEQSGRAPTAEEQARLLRFVGFGATELAQNCFPLPGELRFPARLARRSAANWPRRVTPAEYAALQRATQYAHYTPETIIRALWRAARHLGFTGGRVLEPGMGTGLFFALLPRGAARDHSTHRHRILIRSPPASRASCIPRRGCGARITPAARSAAASTWRSAIRLSRTASFGPTRRPRPSACRLHDYFIARSIARLRPGGIALFVTSTGTMDKASTDRARAHRRRWPI